MTSSQSTPTAATAADLSILASLSLAGAIITTGIVAGILCLYAHTIMPGLRSTDDRTFVGAFQATDRAILNPWFMSCFFGALPLTAAAAALHLAPAGRPVLPYLATAFVLYLGVIVITMAINVPLNDALKAAGDPESITDLAQVRADFHEDRWVAWNLVRTIAGTVSFGLLVAASILQSRGR
jgi:uncharacterized membrane protein